MDSDGVAGHLSPQLLAALPAAPRAQLGAALAIAKRAFDAQGAALEDEAAALRQQLAEAQQQADTLARANAELEADARDAREQARAAAAERSRLAAENGALVEAVKRLNREVARLEGLRASLLRQLQEEAPLQIAGPDAPLALAGPAAAASDDDQLVRDVLSSCRGGVGGVRINDAAAAGGDAAARGGGSDQSAVVLYGSATTSGDAVGGVKSSSGGGGGGEQQQPGKQRPAGAGAAAGAPQPLRGSMVNGMPTASAAGGGWAAHISTPVLRLAAPSPARVDGREFFRTARSRLSCADFSNFLGAIKQLNAGAASRDDTLMTAKGLFGPANKDLYVLFEGLLSRHLPA